jgi:hypothetical protein
MFVHSLFRFLSLVLLLMDSGERCSCSYEHQIIFWMLPSPPIDTLMLELQIPGDVIASSDCTLSCLEE